MEEGPSKRRTHRKTIAGHHRRVQTDSNPRFNLRMHPMSEAPPPSEEPQLKDASIGYTSRLKLNETHNKKYWSYSIFGLTPVLIARAHYICWRLRSFFAFQSSHYIGGLLLASLLFIKHILFVRLFLIFLLLSFFRLLLFCGLFLLFLSFFCWLAFLLWLNFLLRRLFLQTLFALAFVDFCYFLLSSEMFLCFLCCWLLFLAAGLFLYLRLLLCLFFFFPFFLLQIVLDILNILRHALLFV